MTRATALSAAAQLATLQAKAAALENSKAELEAKDAGLSELIGQAIARGSPFTNLRAARDQIREGREDLLYGLRAIHEAVQAAEAAVKAEQLAAVNAELEALADRLEGEAERFEGALVALLDARDAFVRTGAEMSGVAAKGGDVDPTRFRVGNLVDDALGVRLFPIGDRGGATFLNNGQHWAQPVPKLVEPILSTAEIVR